MVQPDDTVWVLSDFDTHGKDVTLALVGQLVGTKILISGSHDSCWAGDRLAEESGVGRRTIINIESAIKTPRIDTLYVVAAALVVPLAEFVTVL